MIFSELDQTCNENLGKSFDEVLAKTPLSNLQERKSPTEKNKERRHAQKALKKSIEDLWNRNVNFHLAQRTSLASRGKQRLYQSFETLSEAKERLEKKDHNRTHIPKEIDGQLDQLLDDVHNWPYNEPVCWTENIRGKNSETSPSNAGQLLKEYLKSQGIDVSKFDNNYEGMVVYTCITGP